MKIAHAVVAVGAAVVVGVGGGVAVARIDGDDPPVHKPSASPEPSSKVTPTPSTTPRPSPKSSGSTGKPTPAPQPVDRLSTENLVTPELYRQVTGNKIIHADAGMFRLSACTGSRTFESLTASATDRIAQSFANETDGFIVEQLAQSASAAKARESADLIVRLVDVCGSIQGGDFGYGDPVTLGSEDDSRVVYFPAFDSDKADVGGYIVFQAGERIGYLDITDPITPAELGRLGVRAMQLAAR